MTDTSTPAPTPPVTDAPPTTVPARGWDLAQTVFGNVARPFAIYAVAVGALVAMIRIAWVISDGTTGALFIGTILAGLATLAGVRAAENAVQAIQAAKVETARATTGQTP